MPKTGFPTKVVLLLAALAALLVALGTRWGIGLTTDSISYLQMAEDIRAGKLILSTSTWPPLYPAFLALVGGGFQHYASVRLLNLALTGTNVFLFAALLFRLTGGSRLFTLAGTTLAALSLVLLETHTAAWSEPLFLCLLFSSTGALALYLEHPKPGHAVLACVFLSLIPLTRYVGIVFVLAGCLLVFFIGQRNLTQRLAFCFFSGLPISTLLMWNRLSRGTSTGGSSWNPSWPGAEISAGISVVAAWLVPGIDRYRVLPLQSLIAGLIFFAWMSFLVHSFRRFPEVLNSDLGKIVSIFAVFYPAFLLATIGLSRHDVPMDQRLLCPVHFFALLLTVAFLARYAERDPAKARPAKIVMAGWLLLYALPAAYGTHFLFKYGRGYLGPNYQAPEIYSELTKMSPQSIRTNDGAAARIWLDLKTQHMSGEPASPLLFFRVEHPLPPNNEAGFKRDLVPEEYLDKLIRETPMELKLKEGKVELYLPVAKD